MLESLRSQRLVQSARRLGRFVAVAIARFQRDDGLRLCASLAYTTLFSIVPVVAVGIGVFAAFPAFESFTESIQEFFAANLLPPAVASRVLDYIDQFARNAAGLTVWGLVFVAITAFLLMGTIETAFNEIWRARRARPLAVRILMYWGIMTLGPVVIGASLTLTSYAMTSVVAPLAGAGHAPPVLLRLVPFALTALALTLLYLVVPNRPVQPRHAAIGGIAAAVIFEIVKWVFAAYLGHGANYASVYGTLAAIPIFLFWIYLSWMVVVLGAEIVALAPDYHHVSMRLVEPPHPGLPELFGVLAVAVRAFESGKPASRTHIVNESGVGSEMVDSVLGILMRAGFVGPVGGDRWTLLCDPDRTTLAEVRERAGHRPPRMRDGAVASAVARAEGAAHAALDQPLRTLTAAGHSTEANSTS